MLEVSSSGGAALDRSQLRLAALDAVRGRLLATELGPEHRSLARTWTEPTVLQQVPGRLLDEARARLAAWLDTRVDRIAELDDLWARSIIQDLKRVEVYRPRISSGPYWDDLDWGRWPVTSAWSRTLDVAKGDRVEVHLSRPRPALGYLAPDPVAWLIRTTETGDPVRGSVVAWSDDHQGSALPHIIWTADASGSLRLMIAAYQPSSAGHARLVVRVNGRPVWEEPGIFFGGVRIPQVEVDEGDIFHAVAGRPGGTTAATDAALFFFGDGFREGAVFRGVNNDLGLAASLVADVSAADATILLSAFGRTPLDAPLLLQNRAGSGRVPDADRDGLDAFLEAIIGTCDAPPDQAPCRGPMVGLAGWDAADTDMDGPTDLEELIGIRRCYRRAPRPPFHDPGRCRDRDRDRRCDRDCLDADQVIEQPLGPAMGADPRRYDVWVEMDGRAVQDEIGGEYRPCRPTGPALDQIRLLYDPGFSAAVRHPGVGRGIAVHWYNDDLFPVGLKARRPRLPSQSERRTWFNTMFTPSRKYSGIFRYMVGTCGTKGQSDGKGRVGIVGVNDSPVAGTRIAHELGHLLGLSHYWDRANPDRTPFYLSLMNYAYMYRVPPQVDWDGTFSSCGPGRPRCGEGFVCVEAANAWRCVPDCGRRSEKAALRPPGFSTGALEFPVEPRELDEIPETGYPRWYLPWFYCYTDERHRISHTERLKRFVSPLCNMGRCVECDGETCQIDWDRDGDFDGAGRYDIDYSNTLDDVLLVDRDDFRRIFETARDGLRRMSFGDVVLLADGFEPGVRTGIVPGGPDAPSPERRLWTDVTNVCKEAGRWTKCPNRRGGSAALFRGPASGDRGLRYGFCDPGDSGCRARYRSGTGATLSLRVKAWSPARKGEGAVLAWMDGYRVTALVTEDGEEVRWRLISPDGDAPLVELRDPGAVGQWTRLVVEINDRKDRARLIAKRGDVVLDEDTPHAPSSPLDLSQLWVGASPDKVTNLTGLIDDVVLVSWPVKY